MSYAKAALEMAHIFLEQSDDQPLPAEENKKALYIQIAQTQALMSIAYSLLEPEPLPDTQARLAGGTYQVTP